MPETVTPEAAPDAATAPEAAGPEAPAAGPADPVGPPPEAPAAPAGPPPAAAPRSRAWIGVLVVAVLLAALVGANVVLFQRVQAARDAADRAALVAATQTELTARLDALDARLAGIDTSQGDTADRVATTGRDVARLRTCVNDAVDAMAKSISSGKATTVTKC